MNPTQYAHHVRYLKVALGALGVCTATLLGVGTYDLYKHPRYQTPFHALSHRTDLYERHRFKQPRRYICIPSPLVGGVYDLPVSEECKLCNKAVFAQESNLPIYDYIIGFQVSHHFKEQYMPWIDSSTVPRSMSNSLTIDQGLDRIESKRYEENTPKGDYTEFDISEVNIKEERLVHARVCEEQPHLKFYDWWKP
jgi:hypothetical protein